MIIGLNSEIIIRITRQIFMYKDVVFSFVQSVLIVFLCRGRGANTRGLGCISSQPLFLPFGSNIIDTFSVSIQQSESNVLSSLTRPCPVSVNMSLQMNNELDVFTYRIISRVVNEYDNPFLFIYILLSEKKKQTGGNEYMKTELRKTI